MKLKINEIYYSIQGESSYMGKPCIFIRLTYCNLRCTYCDSEYTFHEGNDMSIDDIIDKIKKYSCKLVEVTGGEPLFQKNCINLLKKLVDLKYDVLLETSGSLSIKDVPKEVINIIEEGVRNGEVSLLRINESFRRIQNLKKKINLIN